MSIRHQFTNAFAGFFVFIIGFFILQYAWWQVYPYTTAEIVEPIEVVNVDDTIKLGEKLHLRMIINKQSDFTPQISFVINCEGTTYFVEPSTRSTTRPAGVHTAEVKFTLPEDIETGVPCEFSFINSYQVNPTRNIRKTWTSEPFKVIN